MPAPEPMTPPDCDLRDFPFMPLDVLRLRDSGAAALPNPEAFRACVLAWCVSWHQVPAASLPDDDVALSVLLGYGRTVSAWLKVRKAGGLHGWVKCADGRLYHTVVAEKANEAWGKKQAQRDRSRKGNEARWKAGKDRPNASQKDADAVPQGRSGDPVRTDTASQKDENTVPNHPKGQGQGEGEGTEASPLPRQAAAPDPNPDPPDARTLVWRQGVAILQTVTGKSPSACRTVLGKLLRDVQDDCPRLLMLLQQAQEARPVDPLAWLTAAAQPGRRENAAEARMRERDEAMLRMARGDDPPIIDHQPETLWGRLQ